MTEFPHKRRDGRTAVLTLRGWSRSYGAASFRLGLSDLSNYAAGLVVRESDARRPFLFLAPSVMLGVLLYFIADEEPTLWAPVLALLPVSAIIAYGRTRPGRALLFAGLSLAAVFGGFAAASLRTQAVDAPILLNTVIGPVEGIVASIDQRIDDARLLIKPERITRLDGPTPALLRVTLAGRASFEAGARIRATARLLPPPGPVRPGGYDFARDAYFARVGAVGSLLGSVSVLSPRETVSWRFDQAAAIDRMRNALALRIATSIGGQAGAVAAALITGKRGFISDETNEDLRAAGIYHVVSISGLHMVLAAGIVFFMVRLGLSLIPGVALRYPVKQIAAASAMIAAIAYDIFAGSEVATERSLLMTLALFGAVLIGRPALSMRNLVIAALIILAVEPESLLGPSFQMSFAAVAALIAAFERLPADPARVPKVLTPSTPTQMKPQPGLIARLFMALFRHARLVVLTTLLAEAATAPFAAYHFQRFQPLGLIGNMVTIPLVEVIAMPVGFLGFLALPFGLDAPLWRFMGVSVSLMLHLSHFVSTLPVSTQVLPAISPTALIILSIGVMWIVLWSTVLRWLGLVPLALGAVLAFTGVHPDIYVARDGASLAARGPDGTLQAMGRGLNSFTLAQWLAADGDRRAADDPQLKANTLCNSTGCIAKLKQNDNIILGLAPDDLEEDCRLAAIIVTPYEAPQTCRAQKQALVIDRPTVDAYGAIAIYRTGSAFTIAGARDPARNRPWAPRPKEIRDPFANTANNAANNTASSVNPPSAVAPDPERDPIMPR